MAPSASAMNCATGACSKRTRRASRSRLSPARPGPPPATRPRRSSTAYDRFRDETLAADLDVAFDGPPEGDLDAAEQRIRSLPEVVAVAHLDFPFVVPAGSGFYPYLDFLAAAG